MKNKHTIGFQHQQNHRFHCLTLLSLSSLQTAIPKKTSSAHHPRKTSSGIKARLKVEGDTPRNEDAYVLGSIPDSLTHSSMQWPSADISITATKKPTSQRRTPNLRRAHDQGDNCLYEVPDANKVQLQ